MPGILEKLYSNPDLRQEELAQKKDLATRIKNRIMGLDTMGEVIAGGKSSFIPDEKYQPERIYEPGYYSGNAKYMEETLNPNRTLSGDFYGPDAEEAIQIMRKYKTGEYQQ